MRTSGCDPRSPGTGRRSRIAVGRGTPISGGVASVTDPIPFLPDGGLTGAEMRARDWEATSLGPPGDWPPALRNALTLMLECPTAMFLAWGPDLLCFYNDAYRPILGYRLPTALGRPFPEVWASIWTEIEPLVSATLAGRQQVLTDLMLDLSREGKPEKSWWSFTYSPVRDDAGAINGMLCVTKETTGHISGQARLREMNETLERRVDEALAERKLWAQVFETSDALVGALDTGYRVLLLNRALADEFETLFGVRPAVGDSLPELLADKLAHLAVAQAVWNRALAGEEFTRIEEFGDPTRKRRSYEMRFTTLRDAEGRVVGAFQYATDVTQRLREQEQLARAEEALRQAQKMEAVGQLTGGVAHDFNNLLTIIRSSVDFLRRPNLPEERRTRYMDAVSDTVERAAKLTGQLLAFARRQTLQPEVFDVGERLGGVVSMLNSITGARITIETALPGRPCYVRADPSQFETALVNLAVNARDAMDGAGTLTLGVAPVASMPPIRGHAGGNGAFVAMSVTDEGSGIAPDLLGRIFEPFFTTKEVGKGTGLGLSQVIGFAKQSGGDVDVASEPGRGTTFTLYLPEVDPPKPAVEVEGDDDGPGEVRALCVLVVEDNLDVGSFCTQILEDLGHSVVWAHDAEEALAEMEKVPFRFDAVFSDVVMPGMGGVELARRLRASHPDLPVILTTGYSDVLARDDAHGFDLVRKPYSAEQVAHAFRTVHVRRRGREGTARSKAAAITGNSSSRVV